MSKQRKWQVISLTYSSNQSQKDNSANAQLFKKIIMDHYRNPRNKGLVEDDEYVTIFLRNPSCGDDLTVQVKANGDKIESIRQYGTGCSICCSSASMMSELLASKTLTEAAQLINQFYLMVEAKPYDEEALGDAISLQGVAKLPQRIKCATLGWKACEEALGKIQEEQADDSASK
ncbi:MAG: Fe-S cluster assembly sulfur transfer protein SufU [Fastidiosipilaceae bacterium]